MSYSHYDRLSALDAAFLGFETPSVHMHVGSISIFEPGPLAHPDGGVDFDRLHEIVEAGLRRAPRFRQKLEFVPLLEHPVWVDDPRFNVLYHVRHSALPQPGDDRQLKRLAGRIMSQKLDCAKPLWEMYVVEGLEGGRFAIITKVHHCLIDGISGVDLLGAFMGRNPEFRLELHDSRWIPRPAPGRAQLLLDEVRRRAAMPLHSLESLVRSAGHESGGLSSASHALAGLFEAVGASLSPASESPFNLPVGPHRRFDWTRFDLDAMREVKQKLGGKLNDVVLACVAGAVRTFLRHRRFNVDGIDFRVFVPVSTRAPEERGKLGNRVSLVVVHLPVGEEDARRRFESLVTETSRVKHSGQVEGTEVIERLSDFTSAGLLTSFSRLAASRRSYNMVVTNVPGPPGPVYLDGARLLASYPLVPLFANQALGIALLSYDGGLYWGLNADWDALPDLHVFVHALEEAFEELRKL